MLNGLLLLGSLMFALLLVEALMEYSGLRYDPVWEPDPRLGWRHIPGAVRHWTDEGDGWIRINQLGYRDRERRVEKDSGTNRIAVFGDSMTEGVQVNLEQTYPYLLEEQFRHSGRRVEVLNFGVNGYGPLQELLLLKQVGARYQPDLVVLAVFLDNDVADCHPKLAVAQGNAPFLAAPGDLSSIDYHGPERSFSGYHAKPLYWLRRHSRIYRLIQQWRWQTWGRKELERNRAGGPIPLHLLLYKRPVGREWEEAWSSFETILQEFADETERQRMKLVIVSMPVPFVVNEALWQRQLNRYPAMNELSWDLVGPEQRLLTFGQRRGIPVVTTDEAFRNVRPASPLFWGDLGHLTPQGHEVMARILQKHLKPGDSMLQFVQRRSSS